jgi:hypothetical protein
MFTKKEPRVSVRSCSEHEIFEHESVVCNWLADLFLQTLTELGYPTRAVSVGSWTDIFVVRLSTHEESYIPKADIEKTEFHPSCTDSEYILIQMWFSTTRPRAMFRREASGTLAWAPTDNPALSPNVS